MPVKKIILQIITLSNILFPQKQKTKQNKTILELQGCVSTGSSLICQ